MSNTNSPSPDQKIAELVQIALSSGATGAGVVSPDDLSVEDALADLCRRPRCKNYGLSASCPPHVSGPAGFRELKKRIQQGIVVKIDVPESLLFSDQRADILRFLHEMVSGIERNAIEMGYPESGSFAGGSCKALFCPNHPTCRVISEQGPCRHPESARPSMSGFGLNVAKLLQAGGLSGEFISETASANGESMSWVAGLITLA